MENIYSKTVKFYFKVTNSYLAHGIAAFAAPRIMDKMQMNRSARGRKWSTRTAPTTEPMKPPTPSKMNQLDQHHFLKTWITNQTHRVGEWES